MVVPGFSTGEPEWAIPALVDLVRRLAEHNDVEVFALRHPPTRGSYQVFGVTVHALAGGRTAGVGRAGLLTHAVASILMRARQRPFELIHGLWADEPGFIASVVARALGVGSVVSLMGGEMVGLRDLGYGGQLSRINRFLVRIALRSAGKVTVGSNYLRDLVLTRVPAGRLTVLPLGVDTNLFSPIAGKPALRLTGERPLLHVASLTPVKDQAVLLQAAAKALPDVPGMHLHIVGEGPCRTALEGVARELSLAGRVTFHGAVAHDQLVDYYRAAELCLMSSRFESQGMSVLEAAACSRTTIGTAVGVLPQLQPATRAVPIADAPALARAIVETVNAPGLAAEMGRRCLDLIKRQYALSDTAAAQSDFYADLIASRSNNRRRRFRGVESTRPAAEDDARRLADRRHHDRREAKTEYPGVNRDRP